MGKHKGLKEIWSLWSENLKKNIIHELQIQHDKNVLKEEEGELNWIMSHRQDRQQTWAMEVQIPAKYMLYLCQCVTMKQSIMHGNLQEIIIIKQKNLTKFNYWKFHLQTWNTNFLYILFFLFFPFFIRYLAHLHFQCYTKSPPYPPTPTPLPTHSPFLALVFPCTGAYKVCKSNGPLFPVMAD